MNLDLYMIKAAVVAMCACAIFIGILISHSSEPPPCTKIGGTFVIAGRC